MMNISNDSGARQRYEIIDMLYAGVSDSLKKLLEAFSGNDLEGIANNLGDALEGITILMDAVDVDAGGEAAAFLKGLYNAIFVNLSTVMITRDVESVRRSLRYIDELGRLWQERVMSVSDDIHAMDLFQEEGMASCMAHA